LREVKTPTAPGFDAFLALLYEAEALFGGVQRRVADALGIDNTRYNKMRSGTAYTLNVENCLRLARLLGRAPTDVLRAAGKAAIADQLDAYYDAPRYTPLPGGHQGRQMAEAWARLSESDRALVLQITDGFLRPSSQAETPGGPATPSRATARRAR
jgi:transcriptional regulator with XRE-family HTH domain